MKRQILSLVALLVTTAFLSACSMLPAGRSSEAAANEPTPTPIPTSIVPVKPTYKVQRGDIRKELVFNGRISPMVEEELFFRSNGRVRAIFSERNDMVKAGDIIAELEIDDLERQLESARLSLERAQSRLDSAQNDLDFAKRQSEINLEIARLRLTEMRTQSPQDRSGIAIQEKQVELAELSLSRMDEGVDPLLINDVSRAELDLTRLDAAIADARITAPFDGQILSISLSAGRAAEQYKPVVVIADIADLEISSDLISSQMQELSEGMSVAVVLISRPGEILSGEIRRLPYPYGSGGGGTTVEELDKSTRLTLNAVAEEAGFKMGDLVRVTAELEYKESVLWLVPQAIRVFDGRRFVVVQDGDVQRRVDVTVGIQTDERVEIEEGLEEGQTIVGQ